MTGASDGTATWVFIRGTDRLTIRRPDDHELCVTSENGPTRRFAFADIVELVYFQLGFEDHLLDSEWSLVEFSPNRRKGPHIHLFWRGGRDRRKRSWPRRARKTRG